MENASLNVCKVLEENNGIEITHNFVKQKSPDKQAAMERRIATENLLNDWSYQINKTNTREIPLRLLRLYEEAYNTIEKILKTELEIVLGKEE